MQNINMTWGAVHVHQKLKVQGNEVKGHSNEIKGHLIVVRRQLNNAGFKLFRPVQSSFFSQVL